MTRAPMRSSLRSRDSSSTSTGPDPREQVKDCCRKLVAFMCTQVGVGGLIVGYAVVGAFGFMSIESKEEYPQIQMVELARNKAADKLWTRTAGSDEINVLNETAFKIITEAELLDFQQVFINITKQGYDGRKVADVWNFSAALMFCLSIFTMIGYGNTVPKTSWGRCATVMYAVVGIPLYVLYFMNMGKVLAQTFRWLYRWIHDCTGRQRPEGQRLIVPSTACLWVIFGYILAGSITFAEWEKWGYLDSAYFCVTSLCKIGIGDFVPGIKGLEATDNEGQTKLFINFVYLLLGMGLIAMCYNLMREDVREKARETREFLARIVENMRISHASKYIEIVCRKLEEGEEDYLGEASFNLRSDQFDYQTKLHGKLDPSST